MKTDQHPPSSRLLGLLVGAFGLVVLAGLGVRFWKPSLSPRPAQTSSLALAAAAEHPAPPSAARLIAAPVPRSSSDSVWDADWARASQSSGFETDAYFSLEALHPSDRIAVVSGILSKAARNSSVAAVRAAIAFCEYDPTYSLEYGGALISALAETGDFRAALRFVLAEDAVGQMGENGSKWLAALFARWGELAPAQAARATQENVPTGWRNEAMQVVAAAWVKTDPRSLAEFAARIPSDTDRPRVLETVLTHWADLDPAAAHAWSSRRVTR